VIGPADAERSFDCWLSELNKSLRGKEHVFCEAKDGMATAVARRRPSLTNEPTLCGRPGYEAGDARISMTARGPVRLT
jgi:hypothetical protein